MQSKLVVLTTWFLLFVSVSASGDQKFGPDVETDTSEYFSIQNAFLTPFQLTDYNFLGGGAKARGMGGAFFAVSDDPTAASWNPAGLTQLEKSQMNLSFSSYMQRNKFTSNASSVNYSDSRKPKYDNNSISFASVAIPFKIRGRELVVGGLYQKFADIFQENRNVVILDSAISPDSTLVPNYQLPQIGEKVTGRLDGFNIALGGKVFQSLSLGLGVNIYTGKFTSNVDFFVPFQYAIEGFITPDPSDSNGIRLHPNIVSQYSGFNFSFGAMYKWDKLRLGAVVKTPFTLKEDINTELLGDFVELGVVMPSLSKTRIFDFEGSERKWKMPTMVGMGTSYQINSLTLALDVEFRNYSKTELTYERNIADPPSGEEVTTGGYLTDKWWVKEENEPPSVPSLGWRNLTQIRIGGEYMLDTKFGKVPLRIGLRNDPKLFTTQLDSSEVYLQGYTDPEYMFIYGNDTFFVYYPNFVLANHGVEKGSWVNGTVFSLGTGIAWSQIKIDVTYEYARYGDVKKEVFTDIRLYDTKFRKTQRITEQKKFSEKESNNYSRIMISFTGFF